MIQLNRVGMGEERLAVSWLSQEQKASIDPIEEFLQQDGFSSKYVADMKKWNEFLTEGIE